MLGKNELPSKREHGFQEGPGRSECFFLAISKTEESRVLGYFRLL